jgi:hypothetical protein
LGIQLRCDLLDGLPAILFGQQVLDFGYDTFLKALGLAGACALKGQFLLFP